MTNQRTLDMLYHSIYGDPDFEQYDISEDELSHHGVLGMSWGKRHGPPYPLDGVDKRVARAEAKRKREKERRLKKLQRAAKKARKLKKREEKEAADIQKKKQKLVKKGDMDAIKKNAKLFTNEELQYIVERDEAKRSILGKKERDEQEALQKFGEKLGQIAGIAAQAGQIMGAIKQGSDMVKSFQDVKLNKRKIENERRGAIQKEFEMRFGKDDHSPEAQRFIDRALAGEDYKAPKETKAEKNYKKAQDDKLQREVDEYWNATKEYDKAVKDEKKQIKADAKAQKKAEKQMKRSGLDMNDFTAAKITETQIDKPGAFDYPEWYAKSFNPSKSSESNGKSYTNAFMLSNGGYTAASSISRESIASGKDFFSSKYKLADRSSYSGGFLNKKKTVTDAPVVDKSLFRSLNGYTSPKSFDTRLPGDSSWKKQSENDLKRTTNKSVVNQKLLESLRSVSQPTSARTYLSSDSRWDRDKRNDRKIDRIKKSQEISKRIDEFNKQLEWKEAEREAKVRDRKELRDAANAAEELTIQRYLDNFMPDAVGNQAKRQKIRAQAAQMGLLEKQKVLDRGYPGEWGVYGWKRNNKA